MIGLERWLQMVAALQGGSHVLWGLSRPHVIAALVGTTLCPSSPPQAAEPGAVLAGGAEEAALTLVPTPHPNPRPHPHPKPKPIPNPNKAASSMAPSTSPPPTDVLRFAGFKEALARMALYAAEQPGSSSYFPLSFEAKLRSFLAVLLASPGVNDEANSLQSAWRVERSSPARLRAEDGLRAAAGPPRAV